MDITCKGCGWTFKKVGLPMKCSCGHTTVEKGRAPPKPRRKGVAERPIQKLKPNLGVGTEIRRMLGCGCTSIPFREWDLNGVKWCGENKGLLANTITLAPKSGFDRTGADRIVAMAIQKVEKAHKKIALIVPDIPSWVGQARAGLFGSLLVNSGWTVEAIPLRSRGSVPIDRLREFDLVCNHAMVLDSKSIAIAARELPGTTFVNINHSAIPHLERTAENYTSGFLESIRLARELPNCWYASQEQTAEAIGKATEVNRCMWMPTPGHKIKPVKYRHPTSPAVVVIAGRKDPIKNNLCQLVACGLLKGKVRLVLCMDHSTSMQQMIDHMGIEYEWQGNLSHGEWIKYLQHEPDVVLCCSLAESFGYVAAEAMQSGVPVVASNVIRFADPDLVAMTGEPGDIASKIQLALRNHEHYSKEAVRRGQEAIEEQNREYVARIGKLLGSAKE